MTLIKKNVELEFDPAEVLKMEKFKSFIFELQLYLGRFDGEVYKNVSDCNGVQRDDIKVPIINVYTGAKYSGAHYYICVTGYHGESSNAYAKTVIENVFPGSNLGTLLFFPYNSNTERFGDYNGRFWRDDLIFNDNEKIKNTFIRALEDIRGCFVYHKNTGNMYTLREWDITSISDLNYHNAVFDDIVPIGLYYNLFWNLFLIALDDDIYNEQLSNVVELAYFWNFDEHMIRDWCRAVEYVMNGNKLTENCDFECETVEGARFFLHRKL